jgi:hypothetical protein
MTLSTIPEYQFIDQDLGVVATPRLDLPPALGEMFTIIGKAGAGITPGVYRVMAPLERCYVESRHESLVRKVHVVRVTALDSAESWPELMRRMIAWERDGLAPRE